MKIIITFLIISTSFISCSKKIVEPDGTIIYTDGYAHTAINKNIKENEETLFKYAPPDYFLIGSRKDSDSGTWFNYTYNGYVKGKTCKINLQTYNLKMDSSYNLKHNRWEYFYRNYKYCW